MLDTSAQLPEGTEVEIISVETLHPPAQSEELTIGQKLAALGRWAEIIPCDLPTDLAHNHDHYIHGTPKRP